MAAVFADLERKRGTSGGSAQAGRGRAVRAAPKQRPADPPAPFFGADFLPSPLARFDGIGVAEGNLPHAGGAEVRVHHVEGRAQVVLGDVGRVVEQAENFRLAALVGQEAHAAALVFHAQRPEPPAVVLHQAGVAVALGIELPRPEPLAGRTKFDAARAIRDEDVAAASADDSQVAALDHERVGGRAVLHHRRPAAEGLKMQELHHRRRAIVHDEPSLVPADHAAKAQPDDQPHAAVHAHFAVQVCTSSDRLRRCRADRPRSCRRPPRRQCAA